MLAGEEQVGAQQHVADLVEEGTVEGVGADVALGAAVLGAAGSDGRGCGSSGLGCRSGSGILEASSGSVCVISVSGVAPTVNPQVVAQHATFVSHRSSPGDQAKRP
jgi:hypothetical protein